MKIKQNKNKKNKKKTLTKINFPNIRFNIGQKGYFFIKKRKLILEKGLKNPPSPIQSLF